MKKRGKFHKIKKLIAVGDLHGDYCRFIRVLRENNLLKKDSLKWNPGQTCVDLVLMGDYEDWRGETLEGPPKDWLSNIKKLLEYIIFLRNDLKNLRKKRKKFKSALHLLLGNHDDMMLKSYELVKENPGSQIYKKVFGNLDGLPEVKGRMFESRLNDEELEDVMYFLNWYAQGGRETIQSFGSFDGWMKQMDGSTGNFYRKNLKLAVKVNGVFFSHTIPDDKKYWMNLKEVNKSLKTLPAAEKDELIKSYIWSRRVFGFDVNTGGTVAPFSEADIDEFLRTVGAKAVAVGHTPMFTIRPIREYGGKLINLDVHGTPGAGALVEEY